MKAICFRGPAGVGKTTLAYAFGRILARENLEGKLGYISADMFAHISFDCTYTDNEINFKYELISRSIDALAEQEYSIIFDDTFQRYQDYVSIVELLLKYGYDVRLFSLTAPLEVALSRNRSRFWKERIADNRVKLLHAIHSRIIHDKEIVIDMLKPIEDNCSLIMQAIIAR